MLAAPPRYAFSHAVLERFEHEAGRYPDPPQRPAVQQAIKWLRKQGAEALTSDGIDALSQRLLPALDLRFAGQSYEITVPCEEDASVIDRFLEAHRRLYGYAPEGRPIELVTARIEALGPTPRITPEPTAMRQQRGGAAETGAPYLHRDAIAPGDPIHGPSIIEEYAATTVVPAGWSITVLDDGQILLENKEHADV